MSADPGVSLGPTASPPPKRTDPDLRQWLVTMGRCLRSFHRPVCGNKIKHPYLFLPSWKGTPPWGPDHGFLLGGEVLGREKGAGRAAHRPATPRPPPPPHPMHPSPGSGQLLTWSLVFSDSEELSEFSSSDGDMLA